MCGINLIASKDRTRIEGGLNRMQAMLKDRGPDSQHTIISEWSNNIIGIGATRLRIIDRNKNSDQPFNSKDGRYSILFNGEVYNHQELKNKLLDRGIRFETSSDTEVLLFWLMHYGTNGLSQLNGMYSLAFIDHQKEEWFIARDPMGIKPLFYSETGQQVLVSSTARSIAESGFIEKSLNRYSADHYLAYKYVDQPDTLYNNIKQLKPGEIRRYKGLDLDSSKLISPDPGTPSENLKEVLTDAIASQTANINPALMLSGGVDSTLLLALLNKELSRDQIPCYTLHYSMHGKPIEDDDFSFAKRASTSFGGFHIPVEVNESVLQRFPEYLMSIDLPIGDSGGFANWLVAERYKDQGNVLLNGAGADELFAGYNRHKAFQFYLNNKSKPWFTLAKWGKKAPASGKGLNHWRKFASAIDEKPYQTFMNMVTFDQFNNYQTTGIDWPEHEALDLALAHDQANYLVGDVLALTDSSGMANGVEIRVPYLDKVVVNWARAKNAAQHLANGRKTYLKKMLTELGGSTFVKRKKLGFGLPTNHWLTLRENEFLWEFLDRDDMVYEFVEQDKIKQLLEAHKKGNQNNSLVLWSLLTLQGWLSREFG